ncbi:transposase [Cohnella sp. CFH 77786]|uniref:transposase n=1 Tax=Cohnella sp. CFH 77786 TaxID=2662265 RepID=UPI001C60857B|nr:transposase [Cohnella sp. CFH 77786]
MQPGIQAFRPLSGRVMEDPHGWGSGAVDNRRYSFLERTLGTFQDTASKAMKVLEEGFEDATAVLALPAVCRKRTRTTNAVERLNAELRRRERVVRIFPNRASVFRLFGALLMDMDEKWASQKKYIEMNDYYEQKRAKEKQTSKVVSIR